MILPLNFYSAPSFIFSQFSSHQLSKPSQHLLLCVCPFLSTCLFLSPSLNFSSMHPGIFSPTKCVHFHFLHVQVLNIVRHGHSIAVSVTSNDKSSIWGGKLVKLNIERVIDFNISSITARQREKKKYEGGKACAWSFTSHRHKKRD